LDQDTIAKPFNAPGRGLQAVLNPTDGASHLRVKIMECSDNLGFLEPRRLQDAMSIKLVFIFVLGEKRFEWPEDLYGLLEI